MSAEKKKILIKGLCAHLLPTLLAVAGASVFGQLILRNFYRFLAFDETFSSIFSQISGEKMTSPLVLLALSSFTETALFIFLWKKGRVMKVLAVFSAVVMAFLLLLAGLLFTKVNGVMFFDVVRTLVPLIEGGAI